MTPDPKPVTIRLARAGDAAAVASLHTASWRAHYRGSMDDAFLDGPLEPERQRVWAERFAAPRPGQVIVLAEDAETLVGFACAFTDDDPIWGTLIDNLHVTIGRKGAGIGRRLVNDMAHRLQALSPDRPVHLFVLATNAAARAFYDRIGGEPVEHDHHDLSDGSRRPVIRYAWTSPAALMAATTDG